MTLHMHILTPEAWPMVAHWVAAACRHGDETPEQIRYQIEQRGPETLFAVADDAGLLGGGVFELPGDGTLHMKAFGGDYGILQSFDDVVEHWTEMARRMGCARISLKGRRGWDRFLPAHGFIRVNGYWEK